MCIFAKNLRLWMLINNYNTLKNIFMESQIFTTNKLPFMVKRKLKKTEQKSESLPEYSTSEDFNNDVEEKEAFLYTSKINAARNFSKHL